MFTNTADEHWILQTLDDAPQVSVAAGFTGHGFLDGECDWRNYG